MTEIAVLIGMVVLFAAPGVVTLLKRKYLLFAAGIIFPSIVWWVAAFLLADPESWWARRFYDDEKLAKARARYGEKASA